MDEYSEKKAYTKAFSVSEKLSREFKDFKLYLFNMCLFPS